MFFNIKTITTPHCVVYFVQFTFVFVFVFPRGSTRKFPDNLTRLALFCLSKAPSLIITNQAQKIKMAATKIKINSMIVDLWREKIDIFGVKKIVKEKNEEISMKIFIGKPYFYHKHLISLGT